MAVKMRILLADDDLESLSKLYLKLLHKQIQTEATNTIEEVSLRAARFKPHIVFISQSLIGAEAVQFCKKLRANFKTLPVLLINEGDEDDPNIETMVKPLDVDSMMEFISLYK
jgi:DNA-binding response OmpR family regulator